MADNALTKLGTCTKEIRDKACKGCHLNEVFDTIADSVDQLRWEFGEGVDDLIIAS